MTGDDDWFERALTEEDEDGDGDGPADGDAVETSDDPEAYGAGDEAPPEDDFANEVAGASGSAGPGGTGEDPLDGEGGTDDPFGGVTNQDDHFGGGGDNPFGGGAGQDSPFGDSVGQDSPFGGIGGGDGVGEFGVNGGRGRDFSDEDFDSEIDRIDLGIEGLDDMIRGGVPDSSLMAVIGSAGTGKTTFGLQFLHRGLLEDEQVIYITLEESSERVVRSAEEKGWSFEEYAEAGQLAIVDMDPIEMANSLSSIRSELPRLIDGFGATRLVLDSVSLLEMMYDDRATRRNEIYTFARTLKESGVTVLLTSEADDANPYSSRHGIVEYLTDAVYILQYVRPSDFHETRLAVEIQKIRDAHHSREMKPYEITDEGLSVYQQANIF